MAAKYYQSELIEFQNGDTTNARQLTIKRLKALTQILTEFEKQQMKLNRRISEYVEKRVKEDKVSEELAMEEITDEIDEEDLPTYLDTLQAAALVALDQWGVKDSRAKSVQVSDEYIEDNLDYPTLQKIVEIAGSLELGDKSTADPEGKG